MSQLTRMFHDRPSNDHHCSCGLSHEMPRRDFLQHLLFGTIASGLSLIAPQSARAADHRAKALVLSCIDFRFIEAEQQFLQLQQLDHAYDWVALAGASLALTGFPHAAEAETFWDQLALSKTLHQIEKVVIVDHQDCGAYGSKFSAEIHDNLELEKELHTHYLSQAYVAIKQRYPDLNVELYFAQLAGDVIPVMPQIGASTSHR